jgi:hypothetical protein
MNRILFFLIILVLTVPQFTYSQKKKDFTGMLEYKITARDTNLRQIMPDNQMIVYTNDTISRMENFSKQLGKQVTIRHMQLNKSYLLISVQDSMDFAIKTDLNVADSLKKPSKYTYKKKWFKKKIMGMRANKMLVSHPDFEEPIEFLYLKKYSREYLNNFEGIPGLLVKYSVVTADGILDYELVKISHYTPDRNLFGIPSNYKKVTLDEFMDFMLGSMGPQPE